MVYPKKTWVSNEVITTTALNNIEGGVENAYKTSEAVIDSNVDLGTYTHKAARHLSTYKYLIANSGTTDAFLDAGVYNVDNSTSYTNVTLVTIPSNVIDGSTVSCSVTGRLVSGEGFVYFTIGLFRGAVLVQTFAPSPAFSLGAEATKHFNISGFHGGDILKMSASASNAVGYFKDISFNAVEISGSNPEAWP